jgi:hypothetical protein
VIVFVNDRGGIQHVKSSFQGLELRYKGQGCGGEEVVLKRKTFSSGTLL